MAEATEEITTSINGLMAYETKFIAAKNMIDSLAVVCKGYVVNDEATNDKAIELTKQARGIEKKIEELHTVAKKPYLEGGRRVDKMKNDLLSSLDDGVKDLRAGIKKYQDIQREIAYQAQLIIDKKRREQEEALLKAAKEETPITEEQLARLEETKQIQAEMIMAPKKDNLTVVWKFGLTDLSIVPVEFLLLNETAVRKSVSAGVREIPGIKIYQDSQLNIR